MKSNVNDYIKGWFIGNFEPSLLKTNDFEVGIKEYEAGTVESEHLHKIATEFTIVLDGTITMNGVEYNRNDICMIEPNKVNIFKSVTDSRLLIVKTPCTPDDKYIIE